MSTHTAKSKPAAGALQTQRRFRFPDPPENTDDKMTSLRLKMNVRGAFWPKPATASWKTNSTACAIFKPRSRTPGDPVPFRSIGVW